MTGNTSPDTSGLDASGRNGHLAAPALTPYPAWARRRDVTITVFLWVLLAAAMVWAISYVIGPLLIVVLAALLAYALTPVTRMFARVLPLPFAIICVYLALVGVLGGLGYLFVSNAISERAAAPQDRSPRPFRFRRRLERELVALAQTLRHG